MRLYPLPDVLVLADKYETYNLDYAVCTRACFAASSPARQECTAFNPGPFATNGFAFMAYWPSRLRAETGSDKYTTRAELSKIS